MRHKILAAMESSETEKQTVMSDVKECDETFVLESLKGAKIPAGYWRNPRKHGVKAQKRGISDEYICICTGIGRESGAVAVSVNRAKPDETELKAAFKGYLDEDDMYKSLFTDRMQNSYFSNQSLKTCNLLDL